MIRPIDRQVEGVPEFLIDILNEIKGIVTDQSIENPEFRERFLDLAYHSAGLGLRKGALHLGIEDDRFSQLFGGHFWKFRKWQPVFDQSNHDVEGYQVLGGRHLNRSNTLGQGTGNIDTGKPRRQSNGPQTEIGGKEFRETIPIVVTVIDVKPSASQIFLKRGQGNFSLPVQLIGDLFEPVELQLPKSFASLLMIGILLNQTPKGHRGLQPLSARRHNQGYIRRVWSRGGLLQPDSPVQVVCIRQIGPRLEPQRDIWNVPFVKIEFFHQFDQFMLPVPFGGIV